MSLTRPEPKDAPPDKRGGFFIETDPEETGDESRRWGGAGPPDDHHHQHRRHDVDHHRLVLRKADALAAENRLKEAVDCFSMAMRCGSVRPEHLSTLVDCILHNFKKQQQQQRVPPHRHAFSSSSSSTLDEEEEDDDVFDCPGCHRFLAQPVTVACGHSYCRRCLERRTLSRCKVCSEETVGQSSSSASSASSSVTQGDNIRVNVVLCGLLDKWFPGEADLCKVISKIEEFSRRKHLDKAVSLASHVIASADPGPAAVARLSRAEAYMALRQYRLALEDTEVYLSSRQSAEGLYQKAKVLHTMGQVDESLQVFLHCLAVDKDFPHARRQVEMILFDLLSPAGENVKVGLRETAQSASPHLRGKTLVVDGQAEKQPQQQSSVQQQQQLPRAASAHHCPDNHKRSGRSESLERPALSRAHSLRTHGFSCGEEGLKRVCSAPQLGDQEKGSLLKRKLSMADSGPCVVNSGGSKKKQGAGVSFQAAAIAKACRAIPQDLLDANDLECSLCMRLFYEPVTTPCGHTFCKSCLERCLDHTLQCPLCKDSLKEYLASRKYMVTHILDKLIKQYLRQEHEQRTKIHQEEKQELSDLTKNVPIFVCTMAYPTVPCPLHVFEPRYRLMIRRCMDTGTRQFGMCISDPEKGFVDHGCMLIIRSVHFLPDGRSIVDTVGGKRFQVVSRGMKDGYSIADIQHLEDTRVEDEEELLGLQELHDAVYEQARTWFQNLKVRFHNQILQHFGAMPEREDDIQATPNGPACCWWLLAVLPIDPRYQLSVLSMTSLRERLVKIQHILTYLQSIPDD